jgi:hypothetical protein
MAKSVPFMSPYVPNLVPQDNDIHDLQRFLSEELAYISRTIQGASVQASYGAVTQGTPSTAFANIIAAPIDTWDGSKPDRLNRMEVAADGQGLIVEESGVYFMNAQISVVINSGRFYTMTVYKNGLPTDISFSWDTSQQTDAITETITSIGELSKGDEVSIWISSTLDGSTFDIVAGIFNLFRISELQQQVA